MEEKKVRGAERTDRLVAALRRWQAIERQAIDHTAELMEKTDNPLVRQVLEIIRNDSVQHHRVQQFIVDSLTKTPVSLRPEDLSEIWTELEKHDQAEKEVIELGKQLRDECKFFVQKSLLDYLIYDEEKHDKILAELEKFKKNLYPYG
jgi:rubrerythrin